MEEVDPRFGNSSGISLLADLIFSPPPFSLFCSFTFELSIPIKLFGVCFRVFSTSTLLSFFDGVGSSFFGESRLIRSAADVKLDEPLGVAPDKPKMDI